MNTILFDLLMLVLSVVVVLVGQYLVPLIKEKVEGTKWESLYVNIEKAVRIAEQLGKNGTIPKADKKEKAMEYLRLYCADSINFLTEKQLSELIEATVNTLFGDVNKETVKDNASVLIKDVDEAVTTVIDEKM